MNTWLTDLCNVLVPKMSVGAPDFCDESCRHTFDLCNVLAAAALGTKAVAGAH